MTTPSTPESSDVFERRAPRYDASKFSGAREALACVLEATTVHAIVGEDAEGRISLWSAGAEQLYQHSAAEAVGRLSASDLHPPAVVQDGVPARARACAAADGRWEGETLGRRKDGEPFAVRTVVTPWQVDGRPAGFVSVTQAVAEDRTGGEAQRSRADATFRDLLESAPDAMVIVDRDGRIVLVNSQTEKLFGYARQQLLGQPVECLVPGRFRAAHPHMRGLFFKEPRVRAMGEGRELFGRRQDGTEFPVEISLSPIETEDGQVVSSSIRDISDRKRVERALQEKNVELERASLAKDRFLASMSHELRTPLNAIIGFTGTLLMKLPGPLNAEQEKQLGTVKTSARHLLSLINDILDVAKLDSGTVKANLQPVDCGEVIEEVASSLRPLAQQKLLRLELSLPAERVVVPCDRRFLSQILINLAGNAFKFTERGSVGIALRRDPEDGAVEIAVSDTGCGIPVEGRDELFRAFSQVEGDFTKPREGTGLGLHLSQRLAAVLGGRITLESEPGHGSCFTLRLEKPSS